MKLPDQRPKHRRVLKELTFHLCLIPSLSVCGQSPQFNLQYTQISLNKPGLSLVAYHLNLNDAS